MAKNGCLHARDYVYIHNLNPVFRGFKHMYIIST